MAENSTGFRNMTLDSFTEKLVSKEPVPGGGGCAALCACLSAALSGMVASLTVGKKKYREVEPEMEDLLCKAEDLRGELLSLIDRDAEAFEPLSRAYGLPRETEEEKTFRDRVMEEGLVRAAGSPLEIMKTAEKVLDLAETAAEGGSRLAVSDAGCAAAILESAQRSAALNVYVNTRLMKDREKAEEMNRQVEEILERSLRRAEKIFGDVESSLKTARS